MKSSFYPRWVYFFGVMAIAAGCGGGADEEQSLSAASTERAMAKPGGGGTVISYPPSSTTASPAGAYVSKLTVVSTRKVKGATEFTYAVEVTGGTQNSGPVSITLTNAGAGAAIIDGASTLIIVNAGTSSTSTDTVSVSQTSTRTFSPSTWTWAISGNAVALECGEGVVALPDVNTWCQDRPVPFVASRATSLSSLGEAIAQETTTSGATATISGAYLGGTSSASSTTRVGTSEVSAAGTLIAGSAGSYWKDRFSIVGSGNATMTLDLVNVGVGPYRTTQESPGESVYVQVNVYSLSDGKLFASGQFQVNDGLEYANWEWSFNRFVGPITGESINITPYARGQGFSVSMQGLLPAGDYEVHLISMAIAGAQFARTASLGSGKLSLALSSGMTLQSHTGLLTLSSPGTYRYQ